MRWNSNQKMMWHRPCSGHRRIQFTLAVGFFGKAHSRQQLLQLPVFNPKTEVGRDGALRRPRRRAQRQATERTLTRVKTLRDLFRPLRAGGASAGRCPCQASAIFNFGVRVEAAQVIAELIELAKQMREGQKRGDKLGLTDDEVAFYDALETNDSAVKVLGEPALKEIARELVSHVRKSVTID